MLLGWAIPIVNPAKISLIFGFNIQFQYPVPPNITFFNKYFPYVNLARKKRSEDEEIRQYERERYTIYHTLEDSLNRWANFCVINDLFFCRWNMINWSFSEWALTAESAYWERFAKRPNHQYNTTAISGSWFI